VTPLLQLASKMIVGHQQKKSTKITGWPGTVLLMRTGQCDFFMFFSPSKYRSVIHHWKAEDRMTKVGILKKFAR
jgi:hypothetical protein